mmetsp:Transcript_29609/g.65638  ORF Transcript_29609/g.65638 Transcript_29609/m.65638 type:complete len:702 (-) Transcript_29609:18-2123(-)
MDPVRFPPSLLDHLGIEDFLARREFGRERGLNPTPTEAQNRAVDKLHQKLQVKLKSSFKKANEHEEEIQFDLKAHKRVILFEGKVMKKNHHTLGLSTTARRHAILLNDVFLLTSDHSTGALMPGMSTEKLMLHQAVSLDNLQIRDLRKTNTEEDPCIFEVIFNEQATQLSAESESDKLIWLEEIQAAIFCIRASQPYKYIGWQHIAVRDTVYSAATYGDCKLLTTLLSNEETVIDNPDESGMTALHWASMFGQKDAVQLLITAGCDVDCMNGGLNSPLLLASAMGHAEVTFLLIESGADVQLRNLGDMDSMFMSCMYGATSTDLYDIITVLQRKGIEINQLDSSGATPLHRCAASNVPRPIQALVDCGADVNLKHGRSGLTPLQLACCSEEPDPETVRSLLDKGAHPNWRDASMRTSFEMVLEMHKLKMGKAGADPQDQVQEFVQVCLPVLMELVRKGGRYSPESIVNLRPSFQEVINTGQGHWEMQMQPEEFPSFVNYIPDALASKSNWVDDGSSQHCLLCVQKFTYSNRRHHCRTCGVLCCDQCSTKRLRITKTNPSRTPPPTPPKSTGSVPPTPPKQGKDFERVCDGCFNKLAHESFLFQQAMIKTRKFQEKLAAENPELLLSEASLEETKYGSGSAGSASKAKNAATETRRLLEARGEKLQQVSERSEQIKYAASDFKKMTAQLLKQQQDQLKNSWI